MKATSEKREERYESAADFSRDLQRFLGAREVHAAAPSMAMKMHLYTRRQPAVVLAIFIFLLSAGTGVYFMKRAKARRATLVQLVERTTTESRELALRRHGVRQNITVALAGLLQRECDRGGGGAFLDALDPLQGADGLDERGALANRLEAAGQTAFELRFFGRAEVLLRESLDLWTELRGAGDLSALRVRLALLNVQHASGAHEGLREGLELLRGELRETERDHHQVSFGLEHLLASLALDEGRYEDTEAIAWDLMLNQKEHLGAYHPDTLKTTWLLGRVLAWQGRGSASLKYFEEACDGLLAAYGPNHPDTLECQVDFGVALSLHPGSPRGRMLLARASEKLKLILGEGHSSTLHARVHLDLLLLEEQSDGVEERLERSLVICRATLGEEHDLTRLCKDTLEELPVRD